MCKGKKGRPLVHLGLKEKSAQVNHLHRTDVSIGPVKLIITGSGPDWNGSGLDRVRTGSGPDWIGSGLGRVRTGTGPDWVGSGLDRVRTGRVYNVNNINYLDE